MRAAQPDLKLKPLTPRQANALQMTLDGYRKNQICDKLGITQKTLWNWRRLPAWNEQVDVAVRDSSGDGEVQIRTLLPLATVALKKLILTGNDNVKLGAARTVIEAHASLIEREQQQAVMAELEERLNELQEVARNQGLLARSTGPDSCVPVITADTQALDEVSVDGASEPSNPVDGGQMGLFGQENGPDPAVNAPINPHTHEAC